MRVTAAGSLPGTDFRGAMIAMSEHLPEVLPWPELPGRGAESTMIGRALGLIDGLGFDLQPSGWRLSAHPSSEQRRAAAQWRRDLDDAEELLHGFEGVLKVAVAGPWTLASRVQRPRGEALLADHGARRELSQALTEAVTLLHAELRRRFPSTQLWRQVDEPMLLAVRHGRVPTASGLSRYRAVEDVELIRALAPLADEAVLHCCAPGGWLDVAKAAGFHAAWVDAVLADPEDVGYWCEQGGAIVLGVVDTARAPQSVDDVVTAACAHLQRAQVGPANDLILGTACGLASWRHRDVVAQLKALRRAAELIEERLHR